MGLIGDNEKVQRLFYNRVRNKSNGKLGDPIFETLSVT